MTENEAIERLKCMRLFMQINDKASESKFLEEDYIANIMAIKALEEIQHYRAIGTVEECREVRERQRAKEPIILSKQSAESEGKLYIAKYFKCPTCGNTSTYFGGLPNNCHNCGQRLESDTP